jgi:thymidine kinase
MASAKGRLEVIAGCMFSGKTEELLRRIERERIAKKKVLLLKPENENRYSQEKVVTHKGYSLPCIRIPLKINYIDLEKMLRLDLIEAQVIGFDDAQFFDRDFFPFLCEMLILKGKRVIVAGLDLDFKRIPFGPMPVLLAFADEVLKLTAVCVKCGKPAVCTQRIVKGQPASLDGPLVQVGGLDNYEARCRDCYVDPS